MDSIPAPLKGKVAIVTGGSRGLGAGIARKLAQQGCSHIAITYNSNKTAAEEVQASIHKLCPKIKTCAFQANLLEDDFGQTIVDKTLSALEVTHIDIVVANATNSRGDELSPAANLTRKEWDDTMRGNAWSSFDLARAAIQKMQPGGRIIMISSAASRSAFGEFTLAYAAAKAALESVSKNLAVTWGVQYGVTVNSISVGTTKTDGLQLTLDALGPEAEKMVKDLTLLKRHAEVEEVASIVAFVASPDASWVIGNLLPANGGALAALQG